MVLSMIAMVGYALASGPVTISGQWSEWLSWWLEFACWLGRLAGWLAGWLAD